MSLTAGSRLGPYQIVSSLGAGGKGEVYLAEDTRLSRQVAIKRLLDPALSQDDARRRILNEATAAAALSHPSIAAIFDVLDWEQQAFIVMEYVRGKTLATHIRREGPMALHRVVDLGVQLCDAVAAAHAQGIIHRDLKPANVMITPEARVKVLDFGVARRAETTPRPGATDTVAVAGTPAYMAPEQLLGVPADRRSDIYSLGVLLFELATGERPFPDTDLLGRALAAASGPPVTPSRAEFPAGFARILARALAPDPKDRYASAADMEADLRALGARLTELPTVESADLLTPPFERPRARRSLKYAVPVVAVAGLAVLAAAWSTRFSRDEMRGGVHAATPPVVAVMPLQNLSGDRAKDYLGIGVADTLVTALADIDGLAAISPPSPAGEGDPDVRTLAREIGAAYLVQGAVQQSGDEIQVNVRLLRADGSGVWSDSRRGRIQDFFTLQGELAEGLSSALRVRVSGQERRRLQRAATRDPEALAAYWQGRSLLDRFDVRGNVDSAVEAFQRAIARDATFASAHAGLGSAYLHQYAVTRDKPWIDKALTAASEAVRLDPDDAQARFTLASVYRRSGRADDAIRELEAAIRLQPSNDDAFRELGNVLAAKGRLDDAVVQFRKAIAIRPQFWGNHQALGLAYLNAARYPDAAQAFSDVIRVQPDSSWGYQALGTAYQGMGRSAEALANYEKANAIAPTAQAFSNMGTLLHAAGRHADAVRAYERALQLDAGSARTHRNLGDAYAKLGDARRARNAYAEAVQLTRRSLAVNPKNARTLAMLGLYEAKAGHLDEASMHAAEAVALAPADPEVQYRTAAVHALRRERAAALQALERALALGYSRTFVREDDDFEWLRGDGEFQRLAGVATPRKEQR